VKHLLALNRCELRAPEIEQAVTERPSGVGSAEVGASGAATTAPAGGT
jgi:hypothetical protein